MNIPTIVFVLLCIVFSSCSILDNQSSKYNFSDGYYYSRLDKNKKSRYFLLTGGDSIKVFPSSIATRIADTVKSITLLFPPHNKPLHFSDYNFETQTLDIDFLSTLFKFRPGVPGFPPQLNATFNGAVYAGFRKDIYQLSYKATPLHTQNRNISHYGYSLGGFIGVGTVRIDQSLTLNRINYEYDGAALNGGLAAIFGFNKLNFGLNCGVDYLTDKNRTLWVNQTKPWIGISVGLNLN